MNVQNSPRQFNLVGTWQRPNVTIQFTEEEMTTYVNGSPIMGYKALVNSELTMYRVTNNMIYLMYIIEGDVVRFFNQSGMLHLPYQIQGNSLTYQVDGNDFTLTRQGGYQHLKTAYFSNASSKGIQPELVGKWSYLSATATYSADITLYPDGTFNYQGEIFNNDSNYDYVISSGSAESGTWSATDTTITLQSPENGMRTLQLQKAYHPRSRDPVIIIGDRPYVTALVRPPW
jgi:hypothetical protein